MILVLEGLPASGKTTLANLLRVTQGFLKVNESLGKIGGVNNTTDQRVIFQETVAKYRTAQQSTTRSIIDRGYPSMLAWDYCAEHLGLAHDGEEKNLWVRQALHFGTLFEPDLYVYIDIEPAQSLKRRTRVVTDADVWSGLVGMEYCREFYEQFFRVHTPVVRLPGDLSTATCLQMVEEKIHEIS